MQLFVGNVESIATFNSSFDGLLFDCVRAYWTNYSSNYRINLLKLDNCWRRCVLALFGSLHWNISDLELRSRMNPFGLVMMIVICGGFAVTMLFYELYPFISWEIFFRRIAWIFIMTFTFFGGITLSYYYQKKAEMKKLKSLINDFLSNDNN